MTQDKENLIEQMAKLKDIAIEVTKTMHSTAAADFIMAAIDIINDYPKDGKLIKSPIIWIEDKSDIAAIPFPRPLSSYINANKLGVDDYIDWHLAQEKRNDSFGIDTQKLADDIRNKLSPIKNLCLIIKNIPRPLVHNPTLENLILRELDKSEEAVNYLSKFL